MLKVNGEDIETKYMLECAKDDDTRERAYLNHKYIKPFFESTKREVPEFKIDGVPIPFCAKGGRPSFTEVTSYAPAPPPSEDVQEWVITLSKPETKNLNTNFLSTWQSTSNNNAITRSSSTCYVIEMIAGGGGGTGGGAVLAGVGGGAGAYAAIVVDTNKLPATLTNGIYTYAKVSIRIKAMNDAPSTSDHGGIGAANRGTATKGRDIEVSYEENGSSRVLVVCQGGNGASGGDPGNGGEVTVSDNLPEAVTILYSAGGLSAQGGVSSSTITCNQNTLTIGFEEEGEKYKLTRGGYTGVTDGGGASSGAPSQFGNGGIEGKTNNGYNGGTADLNANGAGGGGGHGKAFSQTDGGDGGRPKVIVYAEPTEAITFENASWEQINNISSVGRAKDFFAVGDKKNITLTNGENITLVIMGFEHDELAEGNGKAKVTIGMENLLATEYGITGTEKVIMESIFLILPVDLQNIIKTVNKTVRIPYSYKEEIETSQYKLWLLAGAEIRSSGFGSFQEEGEQYEYWRTIKNGDTFEGRIKYLSEDSARSWWLRTRHDLNRHYFVSPSGEINNSIGIQTARISFCFCI